MKTLALAATGLALLAAASCGRSGKPEKRNDRIEIVVAIEPQRTLAEAIAGDKARVTALLSSGADPETYDPTIAALMTLSRANGYFKLGTMPFEDQLIERLGGNLPPVYDSSAGIDLIEGSHKGSNDHDEEDGHKHNHDHAHDHDHAFDPHIWSSVVNARIAARNYADALAEIDPENAAYYNARFDSVAAALDSVDRAFARALSNHKGEAFMVWHPSLSYFARDYGLRQVAISSETKETTVRGLQRTIDDAIDHGVTLFFNQPGYDPRLSGTVRNHVGARCVEINPLDADWIGELTTAVEAISGSPLPRPADE
ncbi:MAG: zinc ABC transporter substrate-binding protein [Paramuribaculum sp.]|nr:zinc ABC transporter substrate-binding protein [Paramuribaculum sp.]